MTVSLWQDHGHRALHDYDAAVIGAGVVGLYAAGELRRAGLRVAVLDARDIAQGATGRNAGMVVTGLAQHYHRAVAQYGRDKARDGWNLTVENRVLTVALCDKLGVALERNGGLLLATSDEEADALRTTAAALRADGFEAEFTRDDPTGRGFTAALAQPHDVALDPVEFAGALARDSGADLFMNTEVHALEQAGDGSATTIIRSRLLTVRTPRVLLAVNGYAPLLHPYFAAKIVPTRGQVLATAPCPPLLHTAGYAHYGYEYFRQRADGRFVLGGWRLDHRATEHGYEDRVTPEVQGGLEGFMARYFPDIAAAAPITHRWSGVMGFSRDGLPLVGRLPDLPQTVFAVGFTGHGLGLGLIGARRAVDLLLHDADPGLLSAARAGTVEARPRPAAPGRPAGLRDHCRERKGDDARHETRPPGHLGRRAACTPAAFGCVGHGPRGGGDGRRGRQPGRPPDPARGRGRVG